MSSKSKRRPPPQPKLGGYLDRARQMYPDYVTGDSVCDVPDCPKRVKDKIDGEYGGGRAITFVADDGDYMSIYIRVCGRHYKTPADELVELLPDLRRMDIDQDKVAYIDLREGI